MDKAHEPHIQVVAVSKVAGMKEKNDDEINGFYSAVFRSFSSKPCARGDRE